MLKTDFYTEIGKNKLRSTLLVFFFSVFILFFAYIVAIAFFPGYAISLLIFAFIIAIIFSLIGYYTGDKLVLSISHAKEVTKKEDPFLINTVEGLALAAGLPVPKVYLIQEDSINAFATGRNPEHASIAVTSGARKKLNRQELEGVLAHEMSHIGNYDIRFMVLVTVLVGVVALFSDFMLRSFLFGDKREGKGSIFFILLALALAILAPLIAQLIKLALSRKREYLADATAVQLTRYPAGLANALKKIHKDTDKVVDTANKATAHLYIENPLRNTTGWFDGLFSTHPPIEKRIALLEKM
ncbi:zinc metalloprotease HtpX [Candidatus Woesearchaeota archaeon]|nr:MAG: zinc metalloprotease HtpX [Candidatus Woesearchaeota archaeon]